jgi:hypothetical protein
VELTPELIDAWKWEIAVQAHRSRETGTELGLKKVDFLEGAYTVLTCLERAMSGERSPSPLGGSQDEAR